MSDIATDIFANLKEDMLASPVDDVTVITRQQLEAIEVEFDRLRLALSIAHAEGMEEAARIIDHLNGWGSDNGRGGHAEHFAAAIRRAKENAK